MKFSRMSSSTGFYYNVGGTFNEPSGDVDMYSCPWPRDSNGSDPNVHISSNCSSTKSIYLDPNVPLDKYPSYEECPIRFVGNGYCDDQVLLFENVHVHFVNIQ